MQRRRPPRRASRAMPRLRCQRAAGCRALACQPARALPAQRRLLPQAASTTRSRVRPGGRRERASWPGGRLEELGLGRHREAGGTRHLASEGRSADGRPAAVQKPAGIVAHRHEHKTFGALSLFLFAGPFRSPGLSRPSSKDVSAPDAGRPTAARRHLFRWLPASCRRGKEEHKAGGGMAAQAAAA